MLKPSWIPTRLLVEPRRVAAVRPSKARSLWASLLAVIRLFSSLLWLKISSRSTPELRAIRVRELMEDLGGIWIKVGQVLAMHHDLFGEIFCAELSKLQDRAPAFPFSEVQRILEQDLKWPADQVFDRFDEVPIAAASIGQVYQAHLRRENVTVAVKVQRPGIRTSFERDLKLLTYLVWILHHLKVIVQANWHDMLRELTVILGDELDYHIEAASIRRLRRNLKAHDIYAPKVFSPYCGDRVLVMEYIQGVFMSEFIKMANSDPSRLQEWCEENGIRPRKVGSHLFYSQFRQIFEDNLFHVDLHPGNIVLLRDNRIAFLDFGSVGSLEETFRFRYSLLLQAIVNKNYAKAAEIFLVLSPQLPPIDLEEVKTEMVRRLQQWELRTGIPSLPFSMRSFTALVRELTKILLEYRITGNWQYLRVDRSLLTLDASLTYLIPARNTYKMMRRYERAAMYRSASRALRPANIAYHSAHWLDLTTRTADLLPETLEFTAEQIRKEATSFQATTSKYAYALKMLAGPIAVGFGAAFALLVLLFLHQSGWLDLTPYLRDTPLQSRFARLLEVRSLHWEGRLTWITTLAFSFYANWSFVRLRRRLAQPDYLHPRQTKIS